MSIVNVKDYDFYFNLKLVGATNNIVNKFQLIRQFNLILLRCVNIQGCLQKLSIAFFLDTKS